MHTTARDIIKAFYFSGLTDTSAIDLTDSFSLMGDGYALPALECGGHALVMGGDTGPDDTDSPEGYLWTRYLLTPDGEWREIGTGHAHDEVVARADIMAWWNGLPR